MSRKLLLIHSLPIFLTLTFYFLLELDGLTEKLIEQIERIAQLFSLLLFSEKLLILELLCFELLGILFELLLSSWGQWLSLLGAG